MKVSCIMPCGYGDKFVGTAILCFMTQVFLGELELVIVDNNDQPMLDADEIAGLPENFVYVRSKRMPVGALRNEAIRHASGEVICIWDEDDWSSPSRVAEQVNRLKASGKAVTGWHNVLYYDVHTGGTYKFHGATQAYACGASQCFLKSWWEKHPYVETGVEDQIFSDEAQRAGQLDSCDAGQLYVARLHGTNAGGMKQEYLGHHKQWPKVERDALPAEFFLAAGEEQ